MSQPPESRRLAAALVFGSLTLSLVSTLGAPLIPTVAREQHVSVDTAQWLLTVTLLVGAVATPVLGRLGDGAGRAWVLVGVMSTVLAGSVIAATAYAFPQLLIGRGLQGVGYATVPLSIALARDHLPLKKQAGTIAALSISVSSGAGLGYPVTSLIAQHFGYHAAFWFGAAFTALALGVVLVVVPKAGAHHHHVKLDVPGAVLLGGGLGAVLLAVSRGEAWGWTSRPVLIIAALGLVTLAVWVTHERRAKEPLIDLGLATNGAVMGANLAGFCMGMGMFSGISLMNRYLQTPPGTGYGFSVTLTVVGLLMLPVSAGSLLSQPVARAVTARTDQRTVLVGGSLLVGAAAGAYALSHDHLWEAAVFTGLIGMGVGTTFAVMPALIVGHVPPHRTGSALSLNQVLRSSGGAVGSAVSIAVLTAFTVSGAGPRAPEPHGYTIALLAAAGMCLASAVAGLVLVPGRSRRPAVAGHVTEPSPEPSPELRTAEQIARSTP